MSTAMLNMMAAIMIVDSGKQRTEVSLPSSGVLLRLLEAFKLVAKKK